MTGRRVEWSAAGYVECSADTMNVIHIGVHHFMPCGLQIQLDIKNRAIDVQKMSRSWRAYSPAGRAPDHARLRARYS